jgi:hypothetical protein
MGKTIRADQTDYTTMSSTEIFQSLAGGEQMRGAVSKTIRALSAEGYTTGQIAKLLGKRYQHVRNVLTEPVKKS